MAPEILACSLSLGIPLPAKNCAPPLLNWIITGELTFAAVSSTAFTVLVLVTFTAGIANLFCLASSYNAASSSPYKMPARYFAIVVVFSCKEFVRAQNYLFSVKAAKKMLEGQGTKSEIQGT